MLLVVVTMLGLLDGAVSLPEGATCNFSWDFDSFLGKRLTNQMIETKGGISLLQCVRECLDMDSTVCRSVNYNRQLRKCQLNSMDERLVPWDMSSSAGWNYYHKRISSPDRIAQYNGAHCYVKKCAPGTSEFLDRCIEVTPSKPGSFDTSWSKCQQKYGDLLHIYNQEVYDHILPLVEPYGNEARFYIAYYECFVF
ncbi:uncharacterized protein LOC125378837 [Haliotis rufescens]|uniref:uncharacterized protein LOC125378837 n=1 Tax=Haliotis rufescens TaxID=6454 RepID=UPI00201E7D8A|nr:uncharacterized protein LOC125378837 [Haliotis rufescens]